MKKIATMLGVLAAVAFLSACGPDMKTINAASDKAEADATQSEAAANSAEASAAQADAAAKKAEDAATGAEDSVRRANDAVSRHFPLMTSRLMNPPRRAHRDGAIQIHGFASPGLFLSARRTRSRKASSRSMRPSSVRNCATVSPC